MPYLLFYLGDFMIIWLLLLLMPLVTFGFICLRFRSVMSELLLPAERDSETYRTIILALAGFSFTALLALTVVNATVSTQLQLPAYYLLFSFLCYFFTLNLQSYKFRRWHDQLSDALMGVASLALLLSVASVIATARPDSLDAWLTTTLVIGVWLIDHTIRALLNARFLTSRLKGQKNSGDKQDERQTEKRRRRNA